MLKHAETFEQELVCEQIACSKPQVVTQGQTQCKLFQKVVILLWIQSKKGRLSTEEQKTEAPQTHEALAVLENYCTVW